MKKQKKQNLLTTIIILLVIILAMLVGSIVYEEVINMKKQPIQDTSSPEVEEEEKDTTIENDETFKDKYIKFLKVGSDKWPTETFKVLGIDLNKEETYKNAIEYFDKLIDKYYEIKNGGEK